MEQVGGSITVAEPCDDYVRKIQRQPERYKDQRNPVQRVELIREGFGTRPAAGVCAWEIEDWLDGVKRRSTKGGPSPNGKPLKPATLNRLKAHFSAIYKLGKFREKVLSNPVCDLEQRPMNNGGIRYLTYDEETRLREALLRQIENKAHLARYQEPLVRHRLCELEIALGTGMRKGEQYGLKWRDVSLSSRTIVLRQTKNGTSRNVVMINSVVAAFERLRDLNLTRREGRTSPTPADMVFAIGDNKKWWAQAVKEAGIEHIRWHDLRHTFCSRLAASGVSLKVIKEAAGHKTITMADRYSDLDQTTVPSALSILDHPPTFG